MNSQRVFDRIGDWKVFSHTMEEYLSIPVKKYGGEQKLNDLLFYTGLRIICWNILKYAMRVWLNNGKRHDFEKIAHYAQMAWTLIQEEKREAPFFNKIPCDNDFLRDAWINEKETNNSPVSKS